MKPDHKGKESSDLEAVTRVLIAKMLSFHRYFEWSAHPLTPLEVRLGKDSKKLAVFLFILGVIGSVAMKVQGALLPDLSDFHKDIGLNPQNAAGLGAFYLLFLLARPGPKLFWTALGLGIPLELLYQWAQPTNITLLFRAMIAGPGLAASGLLALLWQATLGDSQISKHRAQIYGWVSLSFLFFMPVSMASLWGLYLWSVEVWDAAGLVSERIFGVLPCQIVAQFLYKNPLIGVLLHGIYTRLLAFIILALCLNVIYEKKCYINVHRAVLGAGLISFVFYAIIPMIGVAMFVGPANYPMQPLPPDLRVAPVWAPSQFPRTCYPSMHTCWVLIPYFSFQRVSSRWRAFLGAWAICTMISALDASIGHYVLDLLIAFPYTVAILGMTANPSEKNYQIRIQSQVFGFGVTALLAVYLRFGGSLLSKFAPAFWSILLISVGVSFYLEHRLAQASLPGRD